MSGLGRSTSRNCLDAAPRDRQRRLDELFGLSDYEVAWSNIAQYQRDYETERRVYEKDPDVNGLEKLSGEYNKTSEEYTLLEMELETSAQKLAIAKKALDEADSKLKRLEEKRQAIEELKRKEARLHSDAVNISRTLASLTERIQGKKTILDNLHQRQISIDTQAKLCLGKLEQAGLPVNQPAAVTCILAWRRLMIKSAVYELTKKPPPETCKQTRNELSRWRRKASARFAYSP